MMNGLFIASAIHRSYQRGVKEGAGTSAARHAADARARADALQQDIEKLYMITEALWTLLKQQHGYDDEVLGRLIEAIDLRSGKADGRRAKQVNPACPTCGRTLIGKHPACLYCGTAVERELF